MNSAPSNPPNMKYFTIFCPSQFQDPQGGPRSPIVGVDGRLKKTPQGFRISGCSVPDVVKQKSAFQHT